MARLQDSQGRQIVLRSNHLFGRSRAMHTVLASSDVSAQHAAISWGLQGWSARDLGSRNGTSLDGRPLGPGLAATVRRGAVLEFGGPHQRFTLVDDAPPAPLAIAGERVIEGQPELLAIPSADEPLAVVMFDPDEGWVVSQDDRSRPALDDQEIRVAGVTWRLCIPEPLDRTTEARQRTQAAHSLSLRFRVSADEEYVELHVSLDGVAHALPAKAHHGVLLELARARLEDAAQPASEQGWLYLTDVMKMLRMNSNQLHVSLHRARKELEGIGLGDGHALIERRPTTRQIRLAADELRVERL